MLLVAVLAALPYSREAIAGYAALAALVYAFARAATRDPAPDRQAREARWRLFCAAMVALALLFVALQWSASRAGTSAHPAARFAALSLNMWGLLRLVNFLWEVGSGRIKQPAPLHYALWMTLPFTAGGPLLRHSELLPQLAGEELGRTRAVGLTRDWWAKLAQALSTLAAGLALNALSVSPLLGGPAGTAIRVLVIFPWGWYLSTSGGYNLMECMALLWGIRVPPSFDRPFGKRNISDFWSSWNMTATRLFRDYLFYNRWGRRSVNVYVNTMILFTLVGVWHGANSFWVIWGMWHGVGFCAYLWYKKHAPSLPLERFGWSGTRANVLGAVATYLFVVLGWAAPIYVVRAARSLL